MILFSGDVFPLLNSYLSSSKRQVEYVGNALWEYYPEHQLVIVEF